MSAERDLQIGLPEKEDIEDDEELSDEEYEAAREEAIGVIESAISPALQAYLPAAGDDKKLRKVAEYLWKKGYRDAREAQEGFAALREQCRSLGMFNRVLDLDLVYFFLDGGFVK